MSRYKPIDIDEAFELFALRKQTIKALKKYSTGTKRTEDVPFWKFCDMLKQGGWTIAFRWKPFW